MAASNSEVEGLSTFSKLAALEDFYESTKPTAKNILQLLDGQPTSDAERDAFRFLQRYVRGLDDKVSQFLRFATATDILISRRYQRANCTHNLRIPIIVNSERNWNRGNRESR